MDRKVDVISDANCPLVTSSLGIRVRKEPPVLGYIVCTFSEWRAMCFGPRRVIMRLMKTVSLFFASIILITLVVTGCGEKVCVMGIGDCENTAGVDHKKDPLSDPSNPERISIQIKGNQQVPWGGKTELIVKGGTPSYTFEILDEEKEKAAHLGSVSGPAAGVTDLFIYTAPVDAPEKEINLTVRVRDTKQAKAQVSITLYKP
jgi:hypothetical protein